MKAAMFLLVWLTLASIAHALPVEPDVVSSVDDVHAVDPAHPRVEEETEADGSTSEELVRERRSPGGWQPGRGGGAPRPAPAPQQPRGSVSGSVHRERGVGTVVQAQGQGNVWTSKDGRSRVDAHGQWSKVVNGPARGKPNYNVGATFEHRF